jgi:hypothetical protein
MRKTAHMSIQICSQNDAKSAKIDPKSLLLTTLPLKNAKANKINGLTKNTKF